MKLLFKQRFFSWFDSYDIFDEHGNIVYVVKGQFSWGHCLKIFDVNGYVPAVTINIILWFKNRKLSANTTNVSVAIIHFKFR